MSVLSSQVQGGVGTEGTDMKGSQGNCTLRVSAHPGKTVRAGRELGGPCQHTGCCFLCGPRTGHWAAGESVAGAGNQGAGVSGC